MTFRYLLPLALAPFAGLWAQNEPKPKIEPFVMVQLWSGYSIGQELYNDDKKRYEEVYDRFGTVLRRGRLGLRGQPYDFLNYTFTVAIDGLGKDVLTAMTGPANNLSTPRVFVWDAFLQWKVFKNSEALVVTGGYFRPQLSRESITPAWSVSSMEKAMSQVYIRKHLTGYGHGRAAGGNIGGLLLSRSGRLGLNYNLGMFNPVYQDKNGNSAGLITTPFHVGRAVVYIGDPEQTQYSISYESNYFGRRKGLSIGVGGSHQGTTELYDRSYTAATDMLFNWGHFHIDGEWNWMWREGSRREEFSFEPWAPLRHFTYRSQTGHLRAGYNIRIGKTYLLEPTIMAMQFKGALTFNGMGDANAVGAHAGEESTWDAGLNWYFNEKRLRLGLHYTWNQGDAGQASIFNFTRNNFFFEPEAGAIRRGNWIGLGLNAIF